MIGKIDDLIRDKIETMGYILDEIVYEKENGVNYLRIIIDKVGFIDIDDCVVVSNLVNPLLDTIDIIDESYVLDVCSKEKGNDSDE